MSRTRLPPDWNRRREAVLLRDGRRCVQCGRPGRLEVHHVVPRVRGGSDDVENLRTLCRKCHFAMHARRRQKPPNVEAWDALAAESLTDDSECVPCPGTNPRRDS